MTDAFLAETPANLAALHDAVAAGDPVGTTEAAHRLKGAAANLGAKAMAATCSAIEDLARAGDVDSAAGLVRRAETDYDLVRDALVATVAKDSP